MRTTALLSAGIGRGDHHACARRDRRIADRCACGRGKAQRKARPHEDAVAGPRQPPEMALGLARIGEEPVDEREALLGDSFVLAVIAQAEAALRQAFQRELKKLKFPVALARKAPPRAQGRAEQRQQQGQSAQHDAHRPGIVLRTIHGGQSNTVLKGWDLRAFVPRFGGCKGYADARRTVWRSTANAWGRCRWPRSPPPPARGRSGGGHSASNERRAYLKHGRPPLGLPLAGGEGADNAQDRPGHHFSKQGA